LSIAAPFSDWANWIISIGLGIIAVTFKWNVTVAGWMFTLGSTAFALTGVAAVVGNILIGILIILAVFFPMNWVTRYVKQLKIRKKEMRGDEGISKMKVFIKGAKTGGGELEKP
ncbi:hypothetical protein HYT92_00425, partial [Candidatus Pacearchaeota archaeon]|nr:hypothetical protein [Candidatus Pacearchaeota archaeon]